MIVGAVGWGHRRPIDGGEVVLREGLYELTAPLILKAEDSGKPGFPIVYRAAPGEEVRISAGRRIASFATLKDEALLARLPVVARGQVLVAHLKDQGISDYGMPAGGFGQNGLPGLELFIDDQPMTLARYPNEGFMQVVAVHGETPPPR